MSEETAPGARPTSKFKNRLAEQFATFGAPTEAENASASQPETRNMQNALPAETQKRKTAKQQTDSETVGKTIYFPPDLHRWLKAYAALQGKDISDIVVEEIAKLRQKNPLLTSLP